MNHRRTDTTLIAATLIATAMIFGAGTARAQTAPASEPGDGVREPISGRRIIKHFDMDERALQNVDTIPLHWRPLRAEGFPLYLEGKFDEQAGHLAPPSFRLDLDSGSLAYQYEGNDIAVRPNSDYLVVAWVKTSGVKNARAYLTAYFLDRKGNRLPGTEQVTGLAGGDGTDTGWEPIQVGLLGNVPDARYMGLTLWLSQGRVWDRRPAGPRAIQADDVKASAWFDDITVYRLPRIALTSSRPGNVFVAPAPVVLHPEITDPDGLNLSATLTVTSADGGFRQERDVPIHAGGDAPETITLDELPVGHYEARLIASTHGTPLVWRRLHFARVAEHFAAPQSAGRGLGVVIQSIDRQAVTGQHELLAEIRPEWVKLPVWYAQKAVDGRVFEVTEAVDKYLQAIVDSGGNPVGIQMDDAVTPVASAPAIHSMLDLMSEDPLAWTPLIAGTWSRYTGLIHVWQLGSDRDERIYLDHRLGDTLKAIRREMSTVITEPTLATAVSLRYPPNTGPVTDYRSLRVPSAVSTTDLDRHIRPFLGTSPSHAWIKLEVLDEQRYERSRRLTDYARRLSEAMFLGAGAVFVPAPWRVESEFMATQVCPTEEYLVFRTVSDVLGGAVPVSRTSIDGQVECLVFDRNGQATLVVWDDHAPAEGTEHRIYLGEYAETIDLWGRRSKPESAGSLHKVRIGPMPSFIVNTPTWLMEFRRLFTLDPPLLEANFSADTRTLKFTNTYHEPVSGLLRIVGPENWDVRPSRMTFALQPGEEFRQPVEIRFPVNAEAGVKAILGEFSIDATRRHQLTAPAWFELGLRNIDLDTYIFHKGPHVVVRVSMTNHTTQAVSFDADLIMPARQRLTRLFQNVLPGQSMTKEFVVEQAAELAGRRVRVHLNERQGSRVWNRLLVVP